MGQILIASYNCRNLHTYFHTKDLDPLTYFLGLEVNNFKGKLFINRHKYTQDLITQACMKNATPVDTPLEFNVKYTKETEIFFHIPWSMESLLEVMFT